jgi:hypothetical protein
MHLISRAGRIVFLCWLIAGCRDDAAPALPDVPPLRVLGEGVTRTRFTGEVSVNGRYAYSSSWGTRNNVRGNAIFIWDLAASDPVLVDSVIVENAGTTGDVQAVPEANLLVVAVEPAPRGAIVLYDITTPTRPRLIGRYETPQTVNGVHTAQVSYVSGRLYAFLCIDPRGTDPAKLVIVDITNPAAPVERWVRVLGAPFVHDVNVRDGILLTAEWNNGMAAYDIGGGGRGGTPSAPVELGRIRTIGGSVHNVYWLRDSVSGARFALIGEEGPGAIGTSSSGDIHVVDVRDWTAMREVAFLNVADAGTHNFVVDEGAGVLYAAYYNEGVRAIDVRGDLGACDATAIDENGRCDLWRAGRHIGQAFAGGGVYIWGVDAAADGIIASDMLSGVKRIARATPVRR